MPNGKPTKHAGDLYFDPERFARLVTKLDAAGLAVHIHAIGDRAVRASLDAFEAARKANGDRDNRHQIAHLQLVDPADFPRFKQLGVIADMQLEWAKREPATEGPLEPYLGPSATATSTRRAVFMRPARPSSAAATGTSRPTILSAPSRPASRGPAARVSGRSIIDERIPLQTAIDAYTINAAYAMKQDATTGSLEVGKRADLVVLDRDILSIDPETIADTKAVATYLDGRLVYSAAAVWRKHDGRRTRMTASGGTSARRGCANGCTATERQSRAAGRQTSLVGAHDDAVEGHALELGAGAAGVVLGESGEARPIPLGVVLLEHHRQRRMPVEQ